jgi:hypothetical protein
MPLPRRRWTRLLGGALALLGAATARGQFSGQATGAGAATFRPGGLREGLTTTSLDSTPNAQLGGAGTAESSLVRDADAAQETFFRSFQNGILRTPKLGYGQGRLNISAPLGPTTGLSIFGFAPKPEDAEFKLGNFYLDVFSLGGSVLWSDNINLREVGKESEEIAVVRLRGAVMYQLNEAMRLSAAGTAVWLPFEQELGFTDPMADYTISLAPIFQTQFIYDIPFNKVDVQMIENFTVQSGGFGTGRAFDLLGREAGDLEDRAGRYAFRDTQAQGPTDRRFRSAPAYRNVIGANVSTLLPTVTRLTFGYAHENIWQQRDSLGQQSSSDVFTAELRSERENLRFKPNFSYSARHQNNRFGYDTATRGGIIGPITPYLELRADMGYFLAGDESAEGYTWFVGIINRPRERIQHELDYVRTVTYPDRSLVTLVSWRGQLQASPDIILEAGALEQNIEPLDNPNNSFGGKQFRVEGRFNLSVTDRIVSRLGYAWTHNVGRSGAPLLFDLHTIRYELTIAHTTTFESALLYQHEFRDSNRPLDSYVENVISLTLTRRF